MYKLILYNYSIHKHRIMECFFHVKTNFNPYVHLYQCCIQNIMQFIKILLESCMQISMWSINNIPSLWAKVKITNFAEFLHAHTSTHVHIHCTYVKWQQISEL